MLVNIAVKADNLMSRTQDRMPTVQLGERLNGGLDEHEDECSDRKGLEGGVDSCTVQVAFSLGSPLENRNRMLNLPDPSTTIQIEKVRDNSACIPSMQRLARDIGWALGQRKEDAENAPLPTVGKAGFGVVGHEVGTMRMGMEGKGVVDENLKMNGLENLYICDLSVFPVSPSANPSLTLVALAQRLGDHLLDPRTEAME